MPQSKTLTNKEELFCWYYTATQNAREAAVKAGFGALFAEQAAARLMRRNAVAARIAELSEKEKTGKNVKKGLERLAFGSIADAITLLCTEDASTLDIGSLDLFCISEIKRPKGGGIEIKLYDRQKALETLAELESGSQNVASPFYSAIERGAIALARTDGESGCGE